jgi:hypothetical protein
VTFTTFKVSVRGIDVDPLVPVMEMVYKPGGVAPLPAPPAVVMVTKAWPGGVTEPGLTEHNGVPAVCTGVTVQGVVSKETGLSKLPTAATLMVAIEFSPGSTAEGASGLVTVRVNCP